MSAPLVVTTSLGAAEGGRAAAAALAVAAARPGGEQESRGVLLLDCASPGSAPRRTVLASSPARELEAALSGSAQLDAAARGAFCLAVPATGVEPAEALEAALALEPSPAVAVARCDPADLRAALDAAPGRAGAVVRADPPPTRSLLALLVAEMRERDLPLRVWTRAPGRVAGRRALAGLDPGAETARRAERALGGIGLAGHGAPRHPRRGGALRPETGQALPAVLGIALCVLALGLILVSIGSAGVAKGRLQRAADLAAISAARSMRDDFDGLFVPARRPDGTLDPRHLERAEYLDRARQVAARISARNGMDRVPIRVAFPDARSFAPLRVRVTLRARVTVGESASPGDGPPTSVAAEAALSPPAAASGEPATHASGGGYGGPLAYRQGEPMRPDVAVAFDRMAAAASWAGLPLVVNSAYRSDAEQAQLFAANPDPRWVAPPGTSLHRCGTELDLGPPEAYGWLEGNAGQYGFVRRYPWEPWHFGYEGGPPPCSAAAERGGGEAGADGRAAAGQGLPGFVPAQYRAPLLAAASRHGVSAALLAAQLMAESNFNPAAVSPAGAQGIAQFMPATAAAYGLDDPFDAPRAIDAQARLMAALLGQFGSTELALAAYNAGPGAVAACGCVPAYPETQAYVARILGLLGGAGDPTAAMPALEVRLVA